MDTSRDLGRRQMCRMAKIVERILFRMVEPAPEMQFSVMGGSGGLPDEGEQDVDMCALILGGDCLPFC